MNGVDPSQRPDSNLIPPNLSTKSAKLLGISVQDVTETTPRRIDKIINFFGERPEESLDRNVSQTKLVRFFGEMPKFPANYKVTEINSEIGFQSSREVVTDSQKKEIHDEMNRFYKNANSANAISRKIKDS
ncbi:hypothetical protein BN1013_01731 [Candidatus Rubidus massiliensis]|nr:MAG: hypothetical protein BGO10_09110 [Chlamydia sp. 32-24]CDZ81200.1 hypothetical protein BN1013_01731 [Candidatus Rubidus massiliensis]